MKDTRLRLILDYPFFGALALNLKIIETKRIPTASVNEKCLYYNSDFIDPLPNSIKLWIWLHEISHLTSGHHFRRQKRDFDLYNSACDYAINIMLLDSVNITPPQRAGPNTKGILLDEKYRGMSSEEIYAHLYDYFKMQPIGNGDNNGNNNSNSTDCSSHGGGNIDIQAKPDGGDGAEKVASDDKSPDVGDRDLDNRNNSADNSDDSNFNPARPNLKPTQHIEEYEDMIGKMKDSGTVSDSTGDTSEIEDKSNTILAKTTTNGAGLISGSPMERMVESISKPELSWKDILSNFVDKTCASYYNWMIPNQRYNLGDIIMPTLKSKDELELAVAIDSSGSINEYLLQKFMTEFKSLAESINYTELIVMSCDTRVHNFQTFLKGEEINYKPKGGGGTAFAPVWEAIRKNGKRPACLVYFTDLCIGDYEIGEDPGYPVLYIGKFGSWWNPNEEGREIPFGSKIKMTED